MVVFTHGLNWTKAAECLLFSDKSVHLRSDLLRSTIAAIYRSQGGLALATSLAAIAAKPNLARSSMQSTIRVFDSDGESLGATSRSLNVMKDCGINRSLLHG